MKMIIEQLNAGFVPGDISGYSKITARIFPSRVQAA
jgi:hypothetical protein